jgi:hypothetical protein
LKARCDSLLFVLHLVLLQVVATLDSPFTLADLGACASALSPDLLGLLAIAVLGSAMGQPRRWAHVAAIVLLVSILFRVAQAMILTHYERAFELADVLSLPALLHWWLDDDTQLGRVCKIAGLAVSLCGAQLLFAWAFAYVARPARRTRGAIVWAVALQGIVVAALVNGSSGAAVPLWRVSSLGELASETVRTIEIALDPDAVDDPIRTRIAEAAEKLAKAPGDLGRLGGADVHVLIIESYGRVALRQPELAARLKTVWQQLGQDLHAAGFDAMSGACCPSVSGGGSWLSHAELFSAVRVPEQRTHRLLFRSNLVPLPRHFADVGYHTVEVMPAQDKHYRLDPRQPGGPEDGSEFYGFEESATQLELGYEGTVYHWGRMPDQFALHYLLERVVKPAKRPLFTAFVSVTSHMAWQMVPPFISDWRIDANTFAGPAQEEHPCGLLFDPKDPALIDAYGDCLEYALRAAVGFVCRLPRPSLVFLLGDHQPPIAGSVQPPDHTRDVPIHAFANRRELLDPCRTIGFVPGCEVPDSVQPFALAAFAPAFLKLYSRGATLTK